MNLLQRKKRRNIFGGGKEAKYEKMNKINGEGIYLFWRKRKKELKKEENIWRRFCGGEEKE